MLALLALLVLMFIGIGVNVFGTQFSCCASTKVQG